MTAVCTSSGFYCNLPDFGDTLPDVRLDRCREHRRGAGAVRARPGDAYGQVTGSGVEFSQLQGAMLDPEQRGKVTQYGLDATLHCGA